MPAGWTITAGQGTTSITVQVGSSGGQICVTASNSCGTSPPSCTNITVNSTPPSVGPISGPQAVCQGQTVQYSVPSVPGAISYSWSVPSGSSIISGQGTNTINMQAGATSGNVDVTVTNQCGLQGTATLPVTIYTQTNAGTLCCNDTICVGGSGQITLSGYNGQIVKWQYSTDGGVSWIDINFTGNVYTYAGIMDTTMFRAVVQNGPCLPQNSNPVTIYTIPSPGKPLLTPTSTDLCLGDTVILYVSYDTNMQSIIAWEFSQNGGASWNAVPGWTADSLVVFAPVGTTWWRVKVSGPGGVCADSLSNIAIVKIYPPSQGGTVFKDTTICQGEPFCLWVTGYVGTITNWEYSFDASTWFVLSNTDTFLCVSNLLNTAYFRVRVKSGPCPSAVSNYVTVTVDKPSFAGEPQMNQVICAGSNSGIIYTANYVGNVIGWIYSTDSSTWNQVPSSADDTINFSNLTTNTWYSVIVKNGVCPPDTAGPVKIWVVQPPQGGTILSNITVCQGVNKDTLFLTGYTGNIVQWEYSTDSGYTWVAIQNASPSHVIYNIADTTWFRVKVSNGVCPDVFSDTVVVLVVPFPRAGTLYKDTAFCEHSDSGFVYVSGHTGFVAAYMFSYNGGNSWDTVIKGGAGGGVLPDTLFYKDTIKQTVMIAALISNGYCPFVATNPVTIQIVPRTNIISVDDYVVIPLNSQANIQPAANDTGMWNVLDILNLPSHGDVKLSPPDIIIYKPQSGYMGRDQFSYYICEKVCKVCDTANVYVVSGVYIPDGFTPNDDGINDKFEIGGIENYPDNRLWIYNRWGDLVFSASPYKNEWDGTLKTNGIFLKGRVPDGTYFYVLELSRDIPPIHGFIEIKTK